MTSPLPTRQPRTDDARVIVLPDSSGAAAAEGPALRDVLSWLRSLDEEPARR